MEALAWSTGVADKGLLVSLAGDMSQVLRDEQVRKHALAKLPEARTDTAQANNVLVHPNRLGSRMQLAKLYWEHLRSCGWQEGEKEPYGAGRAFVRRVQWAGKWLEQKAAALKRWMNIFLETRNGDAGSTQVSHRKETRRTKAWYARRRTEGGGRKRRCEWLRQELFEWWSGMRFAVDWEAIRKDTAPQLQRKKLARFTQYVVKAKAKELLCWYLKAQVEAGVNVEQVDLRSMWLSEWRYEYGLSLRKPNRRYKVPRRVQAERLDIGWQNVFRVRAAVAALKGYDPHIENWDQSPFHHNETGSENKPTLAVAGVEVPWWSSTTPRVRGGRPTSRRSQTTRG